jgi:hypothetical protein
MRVAALTIALAFAVAAPASAATQSQVYRDSKEICSMFTPAQVAKSYHAKSRTATAAARAYANGYRRAFRDSAYRGCLAGFKSRR